MEESIECKAFLFAEEEALFFVMALHSLGSFTAEKLLLKSISSLLKKSLIQLTFEDDGLPSYQPHLTTQHKEFK